MSEDKVNEDKVTEVSETDLAIAEAFEKSFSDGKDEDTIKTQMLLAGAKFNKVSKTYIELMIEKGALSSKEERSDAVEYAISNYDLEDENGLEDAIAYVEGDLNGVSGKAASSMIRALCKKNDIDCYSRPKGMPREGGFKPKFYNALRANPDMSADAASDFVKENGSENDFRYLTLFQGIRQLVNEIHSDHNA